MPEDKNKGDAEAYAWELEHPEESYAEFRNRYLAASSPPKKSITRRRLGEKQQVGYARPPVRTQFKPGQSGNPKGRRKGSKNLRSAIEEQLTDKITLREGDKVRRVTRLEAVLLKQLTQALKGDLKAIQAVYASANALGLLEVRPQKPVLGDLSILTDDEVREFYRLLSKVHGRMEPV